MGTHPNEQIYAPEGPGKHMLAVMTGEEKPRDEHELQQRLMWEYYKQQKEQLGEAVDPQVFFEDAEIQADAYQMWEDHGLRKAFRALVEEQRPASKITEKKTRPADGTDEDEGREVSDEEPFAPEFTLDDVQRRRAQSQAG